MMLMDKGPTELMAISSASSRQSAVVVGGEPSARCGASFTVQVARR
jgi:hypothetical protein